MSYPLSEIIVFMLFLPVFMNIILPLGMLVGLLMWRGINLLIGQQSFWDRERLERSLAKSLCVDIR